MMPVSIESLRIDEEAHPGASDVASSGPAFTKLAALIPEENKLSFSTPHDLTIDIEAKMKQCLESGTGCYVLVTGVAHDIVKCIDEALQELGIREEARFTYEETMESLIVRLMPADGWQTLVRWGLDGEIWDSVFAITGQSHLFTRDSRRHTFYSAHGGSKECDTGSIALERVEDVVDDDPWPSLITEVGYSGSLPALRCDAEWWLENTEGQTRMVIIAEIVKNPNSLRLECWEMIPHPNSSVTTKTGPWRPDRIQYFDIDGAGTVSPPGHGLVIPYRILYDTSRFDDPDIIVSSETLSELALYIYSDSQ